VANLSAKQIKESLAAVPAWKQTGAAIARTYQFKDFPAAIQFVNALATVAEQAWHHPTSTSAGTKSS